MSGIRLAVLDDGQFVRTYAGTVHPTAATFHRFVEAVGRAGAFAQVRYMVPVRGLRIWENDPVLPEVDQSALELVPTASFAGIADYLLRSPYLLARNWAPINRAIADSDLVWLRLPASNAPLALIAARRLRVPYFGWVAGSVTDVARAQPRPAPLRAGALAIGALYDEVARSAARGGPVATLGGELFNSVFSTDQVESSRQAGPPPEGPPWTLTWAGRMAGEKGLPTLFSAFSTLLDRGHDVNLVMIGDGSERAAVEALAARLPPGRVRLRGYLGDPDAYFGAMRGAHVLAHPSGAEGVAKVVVEAMAAGVPVVATPVGGVADVLAGGRGRSVPVNDPTALAGAIAELLDNRAERVALRERGLAWAAEHTAERQAASLIDWLRVEFPRLHW